MELSYSIAKLRIFFIIKGGEGSGRDSNDEHIHIYIHCKNDFLNSARLKGEYLRSNITVELLPGGTYGCYRAFPFSVFHRLTSYFLNCFGSTVRSKLFRLHATEAFSHQSSHGASSNVWNVHLCVPLIISRAAPNLMPSVCFRS